MLPNYQYLGRKSSAVFVLAALLFANSTSGVAEERSEMYERETAEISIPESQDFLARHPDAKVRMKVLSDKADRGSSGVGSSGSDCVAEYEESLLQSVSRWMEVSGVSYLFDDDSDRSRYGALSVVLPMSPATLALAQAAVEGKMMDIRIDYYAGDRNKVDGKVDHYYIVDLTNVVIAAYDIGTVPATGNKVNRIELQFEDITIVKSVRGSGDEPANEDDSSESD